MSEIRIAMVGCCADALAKFEDDATCIFGCGSRVDADTRMCLTCRDHSANGFVCDVCGSEWEKWGDEYECTTKRHNEPDAWSGGIRGESLVTINDQTMVQLVEEREELQARDATLYDALTHCYAVAKNGRLPDADARDALRRVMEIVARTKNELDDLLNAEQMRGMHYELLDEEAMEWFAIAEHQFHNLTAEGKRRFVSARKRASRDGQKGESQSERILASEVRSARSTLSIHRDT